MRGNSPSCRGTFLILIYREINIYLKSWTKFLLNNCQPSNLEQKKLSSTVKATTPPHPSPAPLTGEKKIERRNNRGWRNRSLSSLRSCPLPIIPLCLSRETKKQTKKIRPDLRLFAIRFSLNFIRLLRVVITPSVRGENDSKQSDEFQAISD